LKESSHNRPLQSRHFVETVATVAKLQIRFSTWSTVRKSDFVDDDSSEIVIRGVVLLDDLLILTVSCVLIGSKIRCDLIVHRTGVQKAMNCWKKFLGKVSDSTSDYAALLAIASFCVIEIGERSICLGDFLTERAFVFKYAQNHQRSRFQYKSRSRSTESQRRETTDENNH
jgi:hypothetical protein